MFTVRTDVALCASQEVDWGGAVAWSTRSYEEALAGALTCTIRKALTLRKTARGPEQSIVIFLTITERRNEDYGLLDIDLEGNEKDLMDLLVRVQKEE